MEIQSKTSVIGSGVMGTGIAQVSAAHQPTLLYDISEQALQKAKILISQDLEKGVRLKKIIPEKKEQIEKNLSFSTDIQKISDSSLIIEAVPEDIELKKKVLAQVCSQVSPDAIIAGNTSSFSITELSVGIKNRERFLGVHFFNPAPRMPLVEIISGKFTDSEIHSQVFRLMKQWGKEPVNVRDTPGFIVNRVVRPFYCEALRIREENIADECTIDYAMKTVGGFRMGPFELMDLIGIDTNYAITKSMYESFFHEPRYRPSLLQKQMVKAELTGRKTNCGFYNYAKDAVQPEPAKDPKLLQKIFQRMIVCLVNEAADVFYFGVASVEDIDLSVKKGVNYPKGLFEWGREIGYEVCAKTLDELYQFYGDSRYRVSPGLRNLAGQFLTSGHL